MNPTVTNKQKIKTPKRVHITGSRVYQFFRFRCDYLLWLELFGDQTLKKKMEESPEKKLLADYGRAHEEKIIQQSQKKYKCAKPEYPEGNLTAGAKETLQLMQSGTGLIYQGVVMENSALEKKVTGCLKNYPATSFVPTFQGIPDLLKRVEGNSSLGNYHYLVGDIKSSKLPKFSQKMQVTFYSWILEYLQGKRPDKGFIIPVSGEEEYFDIDDYYWMLLDFVEEELYEVTQKENRYFHITSSCELCGWHDYCHSLARESEDISLIPGLRRAQKRTLNRQGIKTLEDAAKLNPQKLAVHWGLGRTGLDWIKNQAQVLVSGGKTILERPNLPSGQKVEYYFDMESDPYSETEYLFGLLKFDTRLGAGEYYSFIAENKKQEKKAFHKFLAFMEKELSRGSREGDGVAIYHYGHYERTHMAPLVEKYGDPENTFSRMLELMVDLLSIVKQSVVLPIESYSLKDVAPYPEIGFKWRAKDASAEMSVVWYNNFLRDGNRKWLDKIVTYNQDDVKATRKVKEWLEGL